jgi:hypothetical protein
MAPTGPPMLRPLPVDLEDLAEEVGEIEHDDDDPDRWLWVDCEGSRSAYHDMVRFIDDLDDPALADRLTRAISGRGAFRRFKAVLSDRPELFTRWHGFSDERQRGRARAWRPRRVTSRSGRKPRSKASVAWAGLVPSIRE